MGKVQKMSDVIAFIKAILRRILTRERAEIGMAMCGLVELVTPLLCDGHILLEGVPGLAKTLTIKTFAELLDTSFKRIQFTPDLLPADLIGTLIFYKKRSFL